MGSSTLTHRMPGPDQRMDELMGLLLRTGVILAAVIVVMGGVIYLTRHPVPVTNYRVFQGEPLELRSVRGIFHEALALRGRGLIQQGLLILIATPIARVALCFFVFLYKRDWIYVVVTLFVLALLLYGLLSGCT
jgi:uncharacterized membrane protein